jgi:V/A-type H+/Na+-transporting ATPase subunit D
MSTERLAATRGTLQKAREQLEFTERGRDVLRMKRDQIAGELNKLLAQLRRRKELERQFGDAFAAVKEAYATLGYDGFASAAEAASTMEVKALPTSTVGVVLPGLEVVRRPTPEEVPTHAAMKASAKLARAVQEAIELGVIEAKVEKLARDLMSTNRKVNALEKVVIPRYKSMIAYIEQKLNEEALQEFFVTKRIRDRGQVTGGRTRT